MKLWGNRLILNNCKGVWQSRLPGADSKGTPRRQLLALRALAGGYAYRALADARRLRGYFRNGMEGHQYQSLRDFLDYASLPIFLIRSVPQEGRQSWVSLHPLLSIPVTACAVPISCGVSSVGCARRCRGFSPPTAAVPAPLTRLSPRIFAFSTTVSNPLGE